VYAGIQSFLYHQVCNYQLTPYQREEQRESSSRWSTAGQSPPGRVHPRPGQEEIKPVMYFVGKQKGLILTSTNPDFLRATFGDPIQGLLLRSGRAGGRGEGFARKLTCFSILPYNM
jgi:hypothetical protein